MATNNKEKQTPQVETKADELKNAMLTQEEFEKKQRQKTREKINTVTRVFGLGAIFLLAWFGIFDTLFELSYFGWIWDQIKHTNEFNQGWAFLAGDYNGILAEAGITIGKIFDDSIMIGRWLPQLGITVIFILGILGMIYLLTYSVVDLIEVIRTIINTGKDITKDFAGNLKDSTEQANLKKRDKVPFKEKMKKMFAPTKKLNHDAKKIDESKEKEAVAQTEETPASQPEKKKGGRRRREQDEQGQQYTSEQLDRLLRGEPIDDVQTPTPVDPVDGTPTKDLFSD